MFIIQGYNTMCKLIAKMCKNIILIQTINNYTHHYNIYGRVKGEYMNININTVYGTNNFTEGGSVNSKTTVNIANDKVIEGLIKGALDLMNDIDIETNLKEDIVDDIKSISEQIQSEEPNLTRLKKVHNNIMKFVKELPDKIVNATGIVSVLNSLLEEVQKIIVNFKK